MENKFLRRKTKHTRHLQTHGDLYFPGETTWFISKNNHVIEENAKQCVEDTRLFFDKVNTLLYLYKKAFS
jgi:hypothetical protein